MADIVIRIDALNDLIQDLLLFARPRPLNVQPLELGALLHETIEAVRRDPIAVHVTIERSVPPIRLQGDATLLRAVFLNLFLNASQAMNGEGTLSVQARTRDGRAYIDVADTGPGIPDEVRDRIFEPFFTTKSRGGGLGLPIARRTVELHGGVLNLTCPPSGGTVVHVELPLQPPVTSLDPAPPSRG